MWFRFILFSWLILTSINCIASPCKEKKTLELNECISTKVEAAEKELDKHINEIHRKYFDEPKVLAALNESQNAWSLFRKTYCKAVYEMWSEGTIGNTIYARCLLKQTKQRTRDLWKDYLTYWDSTPPDLPEPELSDEP